MGWKAEQMWRSCLRKKMYRSRQIAEGMIKKIQQDRNVTLYVYECPICGFYHLTKQPRLSNTNKKERSIDDNKNNSQ